MTLNLLSASLPAILPLATVFLIRQLDHTVSISRSSWDTEYDYIVVGAGSAGSVMAARLSENPAISVLLLEAGGSESLLSEVPIAAITVQTTPIDWQYYTEPQEASCFGFKGRRSRWPRGKLLGGSSAINFMVYVRGNKNDFDNWDKNGATGWSYADLYPYFLKAEDNRDPHYAYNGYHSTGGPLTVETPPDPRPVAQVWPEAGKQMGYRAQDLNGAQQAGFMLPQGTLRRGARCSSAKAYLRPARKRPNLHVVTFSHVTKILFDKNKRAIGADFVRFGTPSTVFARREVIVSAGAVNSPQLLMLSGIGPAAHLKSLGIPVLADLPVGKNLQDHIYPSIHFYTEEKVTLVQHRVVNPVSILKWVAAARGPLTSLGAIEGIGFVHSKYSNVTDDWPDIQLQFISGGPSSDNGHHIRRAMGFTEEFWNQVYKPYLQYDSFSYYPILMRPKSRGFIKLRSTNPMDPPIIDPRYLTDERDVHTLVDAMKFCIKIGFTPAYQKFNAKIFSTLYPGCEQYAQWSDEYLACMLRTYTQTIYHPVGTCKMGAEWDPTAVLDPELRVKGVKGLRVVDASVFPQIITGNTNAGTIAVAERASDLIKGAVMAPYRPPGT
ncbi:Glucose dehydrogenase -like protein [Halotydeus destructor]|nr:Glucose dehydrogenase -like protein [Halotydeus destructor]